MYENLKTELEKADLYIEGNWVHDHDQSYFKSVNPSTLELVGVCASATETQINLAVAASKRAFTTWRKTPVSVRAEYLWKAANVFEEKKMALAEMMTKEMGKVLPESLGEVNVVIETCKYMAGEGRRLFGESVPSSSPDRNISMIREPLGVVACITPWNFPVALAGYKILAALITGNTVVWKPASETALSAKLFTEVFDEIGLPPGVLNLIMGSGRTVGHKLSVHENVNVVSFTGSTSIGCKLSELCSKTLKRISLELGGKNAVIVLKDADLDKTAEAIVRSAFTTTGQRCTAASRVIVEKSIASELLNKVVKLTKSLTIGDGLNEESDIGPLVNENQLKIVEEYVQIAVEEGGTIVCGGNKIDHYKGYFYEPTVVSNVKPHHRIAQEEIFGPVLAFIEIGSFEEAIEVNNDTVYGLSTSIFTNNLKLANKGAREVESGLVYINNGTSNAELGVAFGGMKQSGNGHREVSHHAFDVMTEWKSIYTSY
jgi:aldehyde dehydrogenase (NAD+)